MTEEAAARPSKPQSKANTKQRGDLPWFSLPAPIRRVFDKFPLVTHAATSLPQRAPRHSHENILYVFQYGLDHHATSPSCNPSCLKWQAFMQFNHVPFRTQAANNHASPTGALPFLLPSSDHNSRPHSPVTANKISRWVAAQNHLEEPTHIREETYSSLIDHSLRNAWLYNLYLDPDNFACVAQSIYVAPVSRNKWVQYSIAHQLRVAARIEIEKSVAIVDGHDLYHNAEKALESLATLLGEDDHFFGVETPGLFDASLFAYTHLLLDQTLNWRTTTLRGMLQKYQNLVNHRNRLLKQYFND